MTGGGIKLKYGRVGAEAPNAEHPLVGFLPSFPAPASKLGVKMRIWILLAIIMLNVTACFASDTVYQTIAREASGESFAAQVMVASVIKTRAKERGLTYEQVCLQPKQFSCWNKGMKQKARTEAEIATAKTAWEQAWAGEANLYHDISVLPYWAKSDKVRFICQIGRLKFYREAR
ncbi:cell wall hydrolase [Candidatus Poribacteria bacterium]|nr:cell wall hydrolase [Candidatus Poribacteria bacterium]